MKSLRSIGWCSKHQKYLYLDRKTARENAKRINKEEVGLARQTSYPCKGAGYEGMYHIGSLPDSVKHGERDRASLLEMSGSATRRDHNRYNCRCSNCLQAA